MKKTNLINRKHLCSSIAAVLMSGISGVSLAVDKDEKISLDIDGQNAGKALMLLAERAGVQIVVPTDVGSNIQVAGVEGEYTLSEALKLMLENTGLSYQFSGDDAVLIQRVDSSVETDESDTPAEPEEVVVTGSRLKNATPTSFVEVITRDEFKKLGLNSAEDIIRSLPQNFSSVNAGSTTTGQGNSSTPVGTLGQSSANLRGLGSNATLVLVNGRRIAGSPNYEGDGTINLSTIPANSIERVEVLLEGASAIYGSDALGGVINFILRKDWSGSEATVRYENSANDGDVQYLSQLFGTTWDSGNAMITLSYQKNDSVDTRKAGFDTKDLRSRGGGDWRLHPAPSGFGNFSVLANPGFVIGTNFVPLGSLPEGYSGSSWTIADLDLANVEPYDSAARSNYATTERTETSVAVNFEQELTDSIRSFGDVLYTKSKNESTAGDWRTGVFTIVPASNPHNQLGVPVYVNYIFGDDEGLPRQAFDAELTRWNANVGLTIDLPKDWQFTAVGSVGEEESDNAGLALNTEAYSHAVAGVDGGGNPVPALNFFTGEHDADLDFSSLVGPRNTDGITTSENHSLEMTAEGSLFSISGGDVQLAVGTQLRRETYDLSDNGFMQQVNSLSGVDPVLERDVRAAFFEGSLPLVDADNALPGIQQLMFTVAGRWEKYSMEYQFDGANLPEEEKTFEQFSPKVGFMWQLVEDVRIRGSWSESFRAPSILELAQPPRFLGNAAFVDLDHPGGTPAVVIAPVYRSGNSNLDPETAETLSIGFEWTPESLTGLTVSATYTEIDWVDKVDVVSYRDTRIASNTLAYPEIFVRDSSGNLSQLNLTPINLSQSNTEVVDFNVDYEFSTEIGDFNVGLAAVYTLDASNTLVEGNEPTELVETDFGPDELVIKATAGWSAGDYGLNLIANYSSGYEYTEFGRKIDFPQSFGEPHRVEHYATIDLTGFYNLDDGWNIKAGVRNLLNSKFPFIDSRSRTSYDPQRVDTRGRVIYLDVSKSFDI